MSSTTFRTHTCAALSTADLDHEVTIAGWVHRRRDHGGLVFIDLRDRYGLTQIVTDPDEFAEAHKIFETVRPEWVLQITGKVRARPAGQENKKMKTGAIELIASEVKVLNEAETPPFEIAEENVENEEVRMQFRYLDLRRERLQRNFALRHRILQATRKFFYERDFIEIETPILIKGTPEGAREYLVPSRVHPGKFYVLPQSPQQLKQLSMIAGFDRYMQIVRCFRDEDQRGDRQPEFTQMDLEMSFVDAEDVMKINEEALIALAAECRPDAKILETPFPRMTYSDALNRFGSDKPELRYELEFADISEEVKGCGFGIFASAVEKGGVVKVLRVPGGAKFSRKEIDTLTEVAKTYGAKGLAWIKAVSSRESKVQSDSKSKDSKLATQNSQLVVAHFNHAIHAQSNAHQKFVQSLAHKYSLEFFTAKTRRKLRSEAAARAARYTFLEKIAQQIGAQQIALAHHANDQAETVLLNLVRGSGISGLAGMRTLGELPASTEIKLWRPLLATPKTKIENYAKKHRLKFVHDPTNRDPRFARNFLRSEILPRLKKLNPQIITALSRTATTARAANNFLIAEANRWLHQFSRKKAVRLTDFLALPTALQSTVLREIHRTEIGDCQRLAEKHIAEILTLASSSVGNKQKKFGSLIFRTTRRAGERTLAWQQSC